MTFLEVSRNNLTILEEDWIEKLVTLSFSLEFWHSEKSEKSYWIWVNLNFKPFPVLRGWMASIKVSIESFQFVQEWYLEQPIFSFLVQLVDSANVPTCTDTFDFLSSSNSIFAVVSTRLLFSKTYTFGGKCKVRLKNLFLMPGLEF